MSLNDASIIGKSLIQSFYGQPPKCSYVCSDTGTDLRIPKTATAVVKAAWTGARTSNDSFLWREYEGIFHAAVRVFSSIIGANDPDLTEFRDAGGKIIAYHGLVSLLQTEREGNGRSTLGVHSFSLSGIALVIRVTRFSASVDRLDDTTSTTTCDGPAGKKFFYNASASEKGCQYLSSELCRNRGIRFTFLSRMSLADIFVAIESQVSLTSITECEQLETAGYEHEVQHGVLQYNMTPPENRARATEGMADSGARVDAFLRHNETPNCKESGYIGRNGHNPSPVGCSTEMTWALSTRSNVVKFVDFLNNPNRSRVEEAICQRTKFATNSYISVDVYRTVIHVVFCVLAILLSWSDELFLRFVCWYGSVSFRNGLISLSQHSALQLHRIAYIDSDGSITGAASGDSAPNMASDASMKGAASSDSAPNMASNGKLFEKGLFFGHPVADVSVLVPPYGLSREASEKFAPDMSGRYPSERIGYNLIRK
ncbi:hypothetical protein BDD12DRAFT_982615 [Trichophaea hybrida]|nr:hypothetical protein BDD12DRAFT_982615 [Trichophaea hybrida]